MKRQHHSKLRQGYAAIVGMGLMVAGVFFSSGKVAMGASMLSSNELNSLQESFVDTNRNTTIRFTAIARTVINPQTVNTVARNGKVPYVVLCSLDELKDVNGKKLSKRRNGTVELRVLDGDQKIVASTSQALEKMCAT
jgi:hypothetical protein